ncbi:MAG: glycoside hydrolase family 2 [Bacteroidales bacterium]|nr:glycoside hydrolase family 2 [Bacteroidales bacterium]
MRTELKKALLLLSILLPFALSAAVSPNNARKANRIYFDSVKGHGGTADWKMCRLDQVPVSAEKLSQPGFDDAAWLSARVPGTVLTNLVENGQLPDPYFSDNNRLTKGLIPDINEVGRGYYTYWFRTEFDIPANFAGKKVWLHPEGVNYRAEFWVNGHLFSTLTGMFRDDDIDITEFANIGGRNALAVLVYPVDFPGRPGKKTWGAPGEYNNGGDGNIGLNSTMLMSVGWDFTFWDAVRDRNTGIWRSISLYSTGGMTVRHPFVKADLAHPNYDAADLNVSVEVSSRYVDSPKTHPARVIGEITGPGLDSPITFEKTVELYREEDQEVSFEPVHIDHPALWWPLGKGEHPLYNLKVEVYDGDKLSDTAETTFGIREIVATRETPDQSKLFVVNGKPIFVRGSNWIPEAMLRDNDKRMAAVLRMSAQCGFNLLRLWGGGIVESDYFHQLCDEYGFLVWEEFFMTGDTRHPHDKATYFANVESSVKRVRNHPCVAFYVASNESTEVSGTRELIEKLDGTRPWQQQSECDGIHDGSPYVQVNPMLHYLDKASPRGSRVNGFNPEYGFTGMPHYTSLQRFLRPEEIWPMDKYVWDYLDGSGFGKVTTTVKALADEYGESSSIKEYGWKTQLLGAMNSKSIWDVWNYNKLEYGDRFCSGTLFWSHASPIPMIKNHMWDWYLIPTASLYHTMHALEPIHVQFDYLKNTVSVYNDKLCPLEGLSVTAKLYDLNSKKLDSWTARSVVVPADGVACDVLQLSIPEAITPVHFIALECRDAKGNLLSSNFYWRSCDEYTPGTLTGPCASGFQSLQDMPSATVRTTLRKRADAENLYFDVTLKNTSSKIAFFNEVLLLGDDGLPIPYTFTTDNYFTLLPGEAQTITLEIAHADAPSKPVIHVEGWNVAEKTLK